ncbi:MAG: hypothetical protein M3R04_07365 [bacterium]|nr:hypothetical protein [bacterium]
MADADHKLRGGSIPGELPDYDGDATMMKEYLRYLLYDPVFNKEHEKSGITFEVEAVKKRALADAEKLKVKATPGLY